MFYLPAPLSLAIVASAAAWAIGKDRWKSLRQFLHIPPPKYMALAIVLPVIFRAFAQFVMYSRERIAWAAFHFGRIDAPSLGSYFAIPTISAFADYMPTAFFEEVVWRGFLQPRFISRYGLYRGLFLVSIMWAVFHFQVDFGSGSSDRLVLLGISSRLATCLALGFVLGWLTLHAGSIWPAVIAHGLYNVSLRTPTGYPTISWVLSVTPWAALAWLLFTFWPPRPMSVSDERLQLVPDLPVQPLS